MDGRSYDRRIRKIALYRALKTGRYVLDLALIAAAVACTFKGYSITPPFIILLILNLGPFLTECLSESLQEGKRDASGRHEQDAPCRQEQEASDRREQDASGRQKQDAPRRQEQEEPLPELSRRYGYTDRKFRALLLMHILADLFMLYWEYVSYAVYDVSMDKTALGCLGAGLFTVIALTLGNIAALKKELTGGAI